MKRLIFSFILITATAVVCAQTVLNFQTHAISAGTTNTMKLAAYMEPGVSGNNAIWNFTKLELTGNFEGTSEYSGNHKHSSVFNMANVAVEEFGNFFFFEVNESAILQHGFLSKDGSTMIVYENPFEKLKFPFAFGDSFSGNYSGSISSGCSNGTITGQYAVQADGHGSLLLPGNVSYDNVLRVKETKSYVQNVNDSATHVEIITHRWYIADNTYPILTLISKSFRYANNSSGNSTQAAYNPALLLKPGSNFAVNSTARLLNFNVFPNPSTDVFNIEFTLEKESDVNLTLFDINGRAMQEILQSRLEKGKYNHSISARETSIPHGVYLLKLIVNGSESSMKVVRQ